MPLLSDQYANMLVSVAMIHDPQFNSPKRILVIVLKIYSPVCDKSPIASCPLFHRFHLRTALYASN